MNLDPILHETLTRRVLHAWGAEYVKYEDWPTEQGPAWDKFGKLYSQRLDAQDAVTAIMLHLAPDPTPAEQSRRDKIANAMRQHDSQPQ